MITWWGCLLIAYGMFWVGFVFAGIFHLERMKRIESQVDKLLRRVASQGGGEVRNE